jgi:hypothetical protein
MHKCDCCKNNVHAVDERGLCFSCACIQEFAEVIDDKIALDADASVDLAVILTGLVQCRILERLVDAGAPPAEFIADLKLGVVRRDLEH